MRTNTEKAKGASEGRGGLLRKRLKKSLERG